MKKNINKLKPIIPLVIVKTLKGRGVKPAKNNVTSQIYKPVPFDKEFLRAITLSSYP
tara:strand:+ start:781 stop:951 length:171 start_codon:yes stop_codon:yes gene_type:complete